MKATIVPAQITTVEDRIAGNLGMTQVILLAVPVILFFAIHAALPPAFHNSPYKLVLWLLLAIGCGVSAIRVNGTLLIYRLAKIIRYSFRPRYYIFDKHSTHTRQQWRAPVVAPEEPKTVVKVTARERLSLTTDQIVKLENLLTNPAASMSYEYKKGGLRVRFTEIKEEA